MLGHTSAQPTIDLVPMPQRFSPLAVTATLLALLLCVPIALLFGQSLVASSDVWLHLWETVLGDYVSNSLLLAMGVATGTLLLGVPTAWLTASCEFPLRRTMSLLLMLPMAMPAYIIAYTYTGLLDFAGPVQSWIRGLTGLGYGDYWFFEIHSVGGAICMLSLVLYPYVYLMARAAFLAQPAHLLEASRLLGESPGRSFYRLSLPLARPALAAGVALALMETLADYGTVQYFGVSTFTTGIFRTYYGFGDEGATAQLAMVLLGFVLCLYTLERYSRRRIPYHSSAEGGKGSKRLELGSVGRVLIPLLCVLPPALGFFLPVGLLASWSLESLEWQQPEFFELAWNSFSLAAMASLLSLLLALLLAYAQRLQKSPAVSWAVQFASMGYALPGTIIAIGVMTLLAWLDHHWVAWLEETFGLELGLLFSGTLVALLFAYSIRFLTVSMGAISSGLQAIKPSLDHSARLLGRSPSQVLRQIHFPLLKGSVLTALLIVFVDVMKELPATLILRPFNFNTLAVRAYELASDERLTDAAPASLMIIAVGLLPVLLLNRAALRS